MKILIITDNEETGEALKRFINFTVDPAIEVKSCAYEKLSEIASQYSTFDLYLFQLYTFKDDKLHHTGIRSFISTLESKKKAGLFYVYKNPLLNDPVDKLKFKECFYCRSLFELLENENFKEFILTISSTEIEITDDQKEWLIKVFPSEYESKHHHK